jgi:hypothetical protein
LHIALQCVVLLLEAMFSFVRVASLWHPRPIGLRQYARHCIRLQIF